MKYLKTVFILVLILSVLTGCMQKQATNDTTDAADGLGSNSNPKQDSETINSVLIQRGTDKSRIGLENDSANNLNSYGIVRDIENLLWISSRGGAGIEAGGTKKNVSDLPVINESEAALTDDATDWYSLEVNTDNLWVRLICNPYKPAQGENGIAHKDIMIYLDNDNNSDAYLGIQNPDDETQWTIILLPGYGSWFQREIAMIMRLTTGL